MLAQVQGIIPVAGQLAPNLTTPTGVAVRCARGETLSWLVELVDSDGVPWAPTGGTAEIRVYDWLGGVGSGRARWTVALTRRADNGLWEGGMTATETQSRFVPGVQLYYSLWALAGAEVIQAAPVALLSVLP